MATASVESKAARHQHMAARGSIAARGLTPRNAGAAAAIRRGGKPGIGARAHRISNVIEIAILIEPWLKIASMSRIISCWVNMRIGIVKPGAARAPRHRRWRRASSPVFHGARMAKNEKRHHQWH